MRFRLCAIIVFSFLSSFNLASNYLHHNSKPLAFSSTQNFLLPYMISVGVDNYFNHQDYLTGLNVGIQERNYHLAAYIGYDFRPFNKKLIMPIDNSIFKYLHREKRSVIYFAVEKRFAIEKNYSFFGPFLGAKALYTVAEYKYIETLIEPRMAVSPQIGFFWMTHNFGTKINYEYLSLGYDENLLSKHRLSFTLLFFIPILDIPMF